MTGQEHSRTLGILFLVYLGLQALGLLIAVVMLFFVFGTAAIQSRGDEAAVLGIFGVIMIVAIIFSMALMIPAGVAGSRLLKKHDNARNWAIAASIIALMSFPLGTILGVYGLWFLFSDAGRGYFGATGGISSMPPPPPNSWR